MFLLFFIRQPRVVFIDCLGLASTQDKKKGHVASFSPELTSKTKISANISCILVVGE